MTTALENVISVTGHRPDKLGGWKIPNPTYHLVLQALKGYFEQLQPTLLITGMALGVDQWAAQVAIDMGIPFYAAIPFAGQESIWPQQAQARYKYLLSRSAGQTIVSEGGWSASKMHVRNKWMVDRCHRLLAIWNGSDGGTARCVEYATKIGRSITFAQLTFPTTDIQPAFPVSAPPTNVAQQQSTGAALGEPKEKFSFTKKEEGVPTFDGRILDLDD